MQNSYPNIRDGRKVVATAGTAECLVTKNTPCQKVEITAELDNSNYVVVGDTTVVANLATRRGTPLAGGQTMTLYVKDLITLYLDVETNGDGVTYTYYF